MEGQPVLGADLNCSELGWQRLTACGPMSEYSSMSGLAPQADLHFGSPPVSHVPTGDITPFHSIISSARSRNDLGIVMPIALAVVTLITSSNFVGCSTGISPGFMPRRILST